MINMSLTGSELFSRQVGMPKVLNPVSFSCWKSLPHFIILSFRGPFHNFDLMQPATNPPRSKMVLAATKWPLMMSPARTSVLTKQRSS